MTEATQGIEATQGGWFAGDDPAYLETRPDDRVSYSVLHALMANRGGCEQKAIHKFNTPVVPTDAMRFGSLVDILLFEPDRQDALIKICPGVGDKGVWSAKYKAEEVAPYEAQGMLCVKEKELDPARACIEAILQFEGGWIAEMFNLGPNADPERDVRFQQKAWFMEGEQAVSLRPDAMEYGKDGTVRWVMDLKTADDPSPRGFAQAIDRLGYDIQAVKYQRAVHVLNHQHPPPFWWLAVKSSPPYTPAVWRFDPEYAQYAFEEYDVAVQQWLACKDKPLNLAAGYTAPHSVGTISKPGWR